MRKSVHDAFVAFSAPLEGKHVPFMYLDDAEPTGLVTIGLGNLIDPVSLATPLPFVRPDGTRASVPEIVSAWLVVKNHQALKKAGGMRFGSVPGNTLRLPLAAIEALVESKLTSVDRQLAAMFSEWETWPADAQLFGLSWAWAVGSASPYPKMIALLRAGDFAGAVAECTMNPQRGTIIKRNAANRMLLKNAQRVVDMGLDPDVLIWPRTVEDDVDTQPDLENPASSPTMYAAPLADGPILHPMVDQLEAYLKRDKGE